MVKSCLLSAPLFYNLRQLRHVGIGGRFDGELRWRLDAGDALVWFLDRGDAAVDGEPGHGVGLLNHKAGGGEVGPSPCPSPRALLRGEGSALFDVGRLFLQGNHLPGL